MTLSSDWLTEHPSFQLNIPLNPRFISPHPYTNQDVIALARGPLVYCVEDFDNPWVDDHFKSLVLDPAGTIEETPVSTDQIEEPYVALKLHNGARFLGVDRKLAPHVALGSVTLEERRGVENLHFIPYALRDNRGGKGHMRVGIRRKL